SQWAVTERVATLSNGVPAQRGVEPAPLRRRHRGAGVSAADTSAASLLDIEPGTDALAAAAHLAPALTATTQHALRVLPARKHVPVPFEYPLRVRRRASRPVDTLRRETRAPSPVNTTPTSGRRSRHTRRAAPRVLHLEDVGTVPDRARVILTEQPRLVRLGERVEILVRVSDEPLIARPLLRLHGNVRAIATRMPLKPRIPAEPFARQDRAPGTRRRIQHPRIPASEPRREPDSRRLPPRIRYVPLHQQFYTRTPHIERLRGREPPPNRLTSNLARSQ